jgi:5-methylcytosine-specific restriction endonuclease McrA
MRLSKSEREAVRLMFDGRCAYCGEELGARWHVDHVEPVIRGDWLGKPPERPDRHRADNFMPACARCNISKGSLKLEFWRGWIKGHVTSLNRHHSIYRVVKSFGLVVEVDAPVEFHFERVARATPEAAP